MPLAGNQRSLPPGSSVLIDPSVCLRLPPVAQPPSVAWCKSIMGEVVQGVIGGELDVLAATVLVAQVDRW